MTPSFRLVIERYRVLRDDAIAARARAQLELDNARRMLQTLTDYRDEQRLRARAQAASTTASWLALQSRFADTLEDAIRLQEQRIVELNARVNQCRDTVLRQQQRLKAIELLEKRRAEAVEQKAARQQQQAIDERASLAAHPSAAHPSTALPALDNP